MMLQLPHAERGDKCECVHLGEERRRRGKHYLGCCHRLGSRGMRANALHI